MAKLGPRLSAFERELMRHRLALVTSFCALFCAGSFAGNVSADDPKPCVGASFKVAAVKAACESGGQPAAKKLMNKAKKKAQELGDEFKCKGCHKDLKTYELTGADAVTKLERYLK